MKFKLPATINRIGEGDRKRKPSTRTDVGGEARRLNNKRTVTKPAEIKPKGFRLPAKKASSPPPTEEDYVSAASDDLPEPGGHPKFLADKATKPLFSALRQRASQAVQDHPPPDTSATDILDDIFNKKVAHDRPTPTRATIQERLARVRARLPILKTGTRLEELYGSGEPQGSDDNAGDGQQNAAGRGGPSDGSEREGQGIAGGRPDADPQGGPGALDGLMAGDAHEGIDRGGTSQRGSETEGTETAPDGALPIEGEINALEIDKSLYEQQPGKKPTKRRSSSELWGGPEDNSDNHRNERVRRAAGEDGGHVGDDSSPTNSEHASNHSEISINDRNQTERGTEGSGGIQGGTEDKSKEPHTTGAREGQVNEKMRDVRELPPGPPAHPGIKRSLTVYDERQEIEIALMVGDHTNLICNNCIAAERCSEFQENAVCAFDDQFAGLSSRDLENVIPTMEVIADLQKKRAMRAAFMEAKVGGGQLDLAVSRQLAIAAEAAEKVARLKTGQQAISTRSVTVVSQGSGASGGGLLSKLMSGLTNALPQQTGEVVTHAVEIKETTPVELQVPDYVRKPE